MADQQFDEVSERAKAAADKVKAAQQHAHTRLEADASIAREKASSEWDDVQAKWQEDVAKVKEDVRTKKDKLDAKQAADEAN